MAERMTDERLAEIEEVIRIFGADHPEAGPQATTLETELLQALKAERQEVERLRGVVTDKNHEWAEDQKELWRLRQQIERHESAIASYRADRDTAERKLARLTVCPEEENGRHRWDETGQCWCCEQRAHILIYEATGEGK